MRVMYYYLLYRFKAWRNRAAIETALGEMRADVLKEWRSR